MPDQALTLFTVPVAGTAPAGSVLVVEVFTPNGQTTSNSFFIGSNAAGQTGPSYIAAADCTIPEPATTASIGFPNMHIVMNVTGDAQTLAPCTIPSAIPWLSEVPTSGSIPAGGNTPVAVTFNSTGLTPGAYNAHLCVTSNDPTPGPGNGTNLVTVPVTLTVQAFTPSIALAKTVGTDPLTCATTDEITVPANTDVTYCYSVENTGNQTLTRHDLVDSELGALLNNFSYSLAPGASVFITATTNIAVTTVNTATWTAYNPTDGGPVGVSATDAATVTVQAANAAGDQPEQDRRHRARCLRDDQQGHRASRDHGLLLLPGREHGQRDAGRAQPGGQQAGRAGDEPGLHAGPRRVLAAGDRARDDQYHHHQRRNLDGQHGRSRSSTSAPPAPRSA